MRSSSRFCFSPPLGGSCLIFHRDKQKHTKKSSVLVLFHVLLFVPGGPLRNHARHFFMCYGFILILYDPRALNFAVLRKRGTPGLRVTSPQ